MSVTSDPAIIEPAIIDAIYVNGILPPRRIGELFHITMYQDRIGGDGQVERVVVVRVAMTSADLARALRLALWETPEFAARDGPSELH